MSNDLTSVDDTVDYTTGLDDQDKAIHDWLNKGLAGRTVRPPLTVTVGLYSRVQERIAEINKARGSEDLDPSTLVTYLFLEWLG